MAGQASRENGKKGGRPKGYAAIEAERARNLICERLAVELPPILDKAVEQAKQGDYKAREWLADRGYGKATQFMMTKDGEGNEKEVTAIVVAAQHALDELAHDTTPENT